MKGMSGISQSRKFSIGVLYVVLATVLLCFGYIPAEIWERATSLVISALLVTQGIQNAALGWKGSGRDKPPS